MPIKTWATVMPSTLISTVKVYRGVVSIYESHLIFYFNILLCFLVKFSKASCSAGGKTAYTDRASPLLPGHPHLFILNSTFCIREMNFWVIHLSDKRACDHNSKGLNGHAKSANASSTESLSAFV